MSKVLRQPRSMASLAVVAALLAAAVLLPHPTLGEVREWAHSVGPTFPLLFFAVHALVTVAPVPRTLFTLSAGVLFGAVTGIAVAVAASTVSAVLALILVRALGRDVVARRATHRALRTVDESLRRRGWLAVASLRLIAPIPFSVVNYCCGVSAVRVAPFALATVIGVLPGTVGIVVLGDALGGRTHPALLVLSACCVAIGIVGLVYEYRRATGKPAPLNDAHQVSSLDIHTSSP